MPGCNSEMDSSSSTIMAAFGNPLLDLVISVTQEQEDEIVKKYGIQRHVGQEYDTIASGMYSFVSEWPGEITLSPGGCSLNTCRVIQWLQSGVQDKSAKHQTVFFGSVGKDDKQTLLTNLVQKDNVITRFAEFEDHPTGHCLALANNQERTLIANIGAANYYTLKHLVEHEELLFHSKNVSIIYVEGFFMSHSPEVTIYLAENCRKFNITFAFNLCGGYVCENKEYVQNVLKILPKIDLLFGNLAEFRLFTETARKYSLLSKNSLLEKIICKKFPVGDINKDLDDQNNRQLIFVTDGPRPVRVIDATKGIEMSIPVISIPSNKIKDTVGAGDSFIAGYLYGLLDKKSNLVSIKRGIYASYEMIKMEGTILPQHFPVLPN